MLVLLQCVKAYHACCLHQLLQTKDHPLLDLAQSRCSWSSSQVGLGQYLEALQDPPAKTFTAVLVCLCHSLNHVGTRLAAEKKKQKLHFTTICVRTGIWNVGRAEKERRSKQPTVLSVWTWHIGFCSNDTAEKQRKSVQSKAVLS